jgi:hypothetical protein
MEGVEENTIETMPNDLIFTPNGKNDTSGNQ